MKFIPLIICLMATHTMAASLKLNCQLKHNYQNKLETSIDLRDMEKNQSLGTYEQFEFIVSSMGGQKIELQLLDHSEPSRSYASGFISSTNQKLELIIWKRDYLVEANCSLK